MRLGGVGYVPTSTALIPPNPPLRKDLMGETVCFWESFTEERVSSVEEVSDMVGRRGS